MYVSISIIHNHTQLLARRDKTGICDDAECPTGLEFSEASVGARVCVLNTEKTLGVPIEDCRAKVPRDVATDR